MAIKDSSIMGFERVFWSSKAKFIPRAMVSLVLFDLSGTNQGVTMSEL